MGNRTDNFNRNNSTTALGTPSDGGTDWVAQAGTWGINTNQGYDVSAGAQESAVLESSLANVIVQVTVSGANMDDAGIVVRAADSLNYLLVVISASTSTITLYKQVAGSFTNLTSGSATVNAGDIWKVTADSSNLITIYQNGTSLFSFTESAGSTNTKHGLRTHNNGAPRFDDFSITDITFVPPATSQLTPAFTQSSSSPGWYQTYV